MHEIIICAGEVEIEQVLQAHKVRGGDSAAAVRVCATNQQLAAVLAQSAGRYTGKRVSFFSVKTEAGVRSRPLSDIMFCRSQGHRFCVHTADGETLTSCNTRCRFSQSIEVLLGDERFLQCSRSAVVNLSYAQSVDETHIKMYDGTLLPFSLQRQKELRGSTKVKINF